MTLAGMLLLIMKNQRMDLVNYDPGSFSNSEVSKVVMVETIDKNDDDSVMDTSCSSESTTNEEVLFVRFSIKLTGQLLVNLQNSHLSFLHSYALE